MKEILEQTKKNPYVSEKELELGIKAIVKELTKENIRKANTKFKSRIGTSKTDEKRMNIREYWLKKQAEEEEQ